MSAALLEIQHFRHWNKKRSLFRISACILDLCPTITEGAKTAQASRNPNIKPTPCRTETDTI